MGSVPNHELVEWAQDKRCHSGYQNRVLHVIGYCMSGHALAHSGRGQSGYLKEGAVCLDTLLHNKGYWLHPCRRGESYVKTGFHKHR